MLHYTTLPYPTLPYTTLHNTTLHYTTLRYATLHYTTLRYTTLHYTTPHHTTPHHTTPHHTTPHHTTLHYTTLHYVSEHGVRTCGYVLKTRGYRNGLTLRTSTGSKPLSGYIWWGSKYEMSHLPHNPASGKPGQTVLAISASPISPGGNVLYKVST